MAGRTRKFVHRTHLKYPQAAVAKFHSDAHALRLLTPPPVFVQMHQVEPLCEGSVSDFTMWMGPVPVRWTALHHNVDVHNGFTDEQVRGPFNRWVHQHRFEPLDAASTVIVDEIEAVFGSGPWEGLISRVMWWGLPVMFAYRGMILSRVLRHETAKLEAV